MRSFLSRFQPNSPLSDDELFNKKRKAWLDGEGLHLNAEQIKRLSLDHQWLIEIVGNLIYGKRR